MVTNMDRALPVQNKSLLIPDVGAMIQSVLYCTKSEISKEIGKPSKFALDVIREEVKDLEPRKCVMVGDNINTDILFGKNCEMTTVLTLTGITSRDDLRRSSVKPSFVVENLKALV